jgi:type I restriction enzyme M protein
MLNNKELARLIDELWNKFWSGGIANPLTAIEQITYLIFMKRIDDLDLERKQKAEFSDEDYISIFEGMFPEETEDEDKINRVPKETLRWSHFKNISPNDLKLKHIQEYVFPFIKELGGENAHFTTYMKNAVFIIPTPSLLDEAIETIEQIFAEIKKDTNEHQDIQGDVYEMLLNEIASAGKNGQFRTPRHIIQMVVELVDPQPNHKVGDPACGTAGFLLGAYQHTQKILKESGALASMKDEEKEVYENQYKGYDIDVTMVRLGLMNLMMHGIDNPNIEYTDTLSKKFNHAEIGSYDTILANPPFTGNLNKGEIDSETLNLSTTKTELLFIERIYTMLRKGGTAGIIIPQGVLFGTAKAFIAARKIMIEDSQLKAVITMPSGVFKPYAGVATAVLIFTKTGQTDDVWFYEMAGDGLTLDDKRQASNVNDIPDVIEQYKRRELKQKNDRKAKYFLVPKAEIAENDYDLSFNSYKEEVYESVEYDAPEVILGKLDVIEEGIIDGLKSIKELYV